MARDLPILFSGPMIRALMREVEALGTGKVMTRRMAWRDAKFGLQDYASEQQEGMECRGWNVVQEGNLFRVFKPTLWQKVKPGDRLWVRERTMCVDRSTTLNSIDVRYEASAAIRKNIRVPDRLKYIPQVGKRLSMGCFREASRLTLEVTAVKIEPLQEISENDCIAEGIERTKTKRGFYNPLFGHGAVRLDGPIPTAREAFKILWEELHGAESWEANPPLVAISFNVRACNIDHLGLAA